MFPLRCLHPAGRQRRRLVLTGTTAYQGFRRCGGLQPLLLVLVARPTGSAGYPHAQVSLPVAPGVLGNAAALW